jgi:uncharacterized membrane protein SirB2
MDYLTLKHLHMSLAVASGAFFLLRGAWMVSGSPLLARAWVQRLPHLVDTLLLSSALGLAFWARLYPHQQPWLLAKLVALTAYILLGAVALKHGRTRLTRLAALFGALMAFGYIAGSAITKNPWFILGADA